jgi:hypothetical protein
VSEVALRACALRFAVAATALAPLLLAAPAHAADEEIQVYMDEMNKAGGYGLDVHLNYVPSGRRANVDYAGEMTSQDRWRITPEWSYGLTDNIELGAYLPLITVDPHGGAEWGGVKGRIKFIAPHAEDSHFFWGANFELGRVRKELDINPWNAELKGIVGYRTGPWTVAGNLNVDWTVSGPQPEPTTLQLATKVSYQLRPDLSVGLESYNGLGQARRISNLRDEDQQIYLVADKSFGKWDLNLGAGWGYGQPEDHFVIKAIVGVPID